MKVDDWDSLINEAYKIAEKYSDEYKSRLELENAEITKQGANDYWIDIVNSGKKFETNKNGLVLPFLLGVTNVDPIVGTKKIYINGEEEKIEGLEILLDNGIKINTSTNTLLKTLNRGYVKANDLTLDDELDVQYYEH